MKTITILVAAAAMAVPAAAADQAISRNVHFSDLNLESEVGRSELQRRLARAVGSICAMTPAASSAAMLDEQARCIAATSAGLDAEIDAAVRANRARQARVASK
ncbi:MAG: UrcA family protein [Sandaracinobacteroides sp.]